MPYKLILSVDCTTLEQNTVLAEVKDVPTVSAFARGLNMFNAF